MCCSRIQTFCQTVDLRSHNAADAANAYISTSPDDTEGTQSSFQELLSGEISASGLFNIFLLILSKLLSFH